MAYCFFVYFYLHLFIYVIYIYYISFAVVVTVVVVIPVVPELLIQQSVFLSLPVWKLFCSPGREHTVHLLGTQTGAPNEI